MKKIIVLMFLHMFVFLTVVGCNTSTEKENVNKTKETLETVSATEVVEVTNTPEAEELSAISLASAEGYLAEWGNLYEFFISVKYPVINVAYEDSTKYVELNEVFDELNKENRKSRLDLFNAHVEAAKEMSDDSLDSFDPFEVTEKVHVRRADSKVVSLLFSGYTYLTDYVESYYYRGENYDSKTGEKLKLKDVVADVNQLPAMIEEQFETFWDMVNLDPDRDLDAILSNEEELSWTLDNNGLTFYFNPHTIAFYDTGVQIVTLTFEEYPDLLKPEYRECLPSYGIELVDETPFYSDVTGDGKTDELLYFIIEGDGENAGSLNIYVNGDCYEEEIYAVSAKTTYVRTKEGENLLYVELVYIDEYVETLCFKLGEQVEKIGELDSRMRIIYQENGEYITTRDVFTNPECFYMSAPTSMLSRITGYAKFKLGKSGLPEMVDSKYLFEEQDMLYLGLLRDLEVEVIDSQTEEVKEKKVISAGDKVVYMGTDNANYAYLQLEDGTMVKVKADMSGWPVTIEGIDIEEIFSGLLIFG